MQKEETTKKPDSIGMIFAKSGGAKCCICEEEIPCYDSSCIGFSKTKRGTVLFFHKRCFIKGE